VRGREDVVLRTTKYSHHVPKRPGSTYGNPFALAWRGKIPSARVSAHVRAPAAANVNVVNAYMYIFICINICRRPYM